MEKALTSRALQAKKTKKKICKCSTNLIKRYGYDKLTIEQITKESNVSVGTFYHYYSSKFALLVEIYWHGDHYFLNNVVQLKKKYKKCVERVSEYFVLYADLCLNDGIEMTRSLYVPANKMFITHGRAMQELLTQMLKQGQANEEITDTIPAESITEQLFVVGRGVVFDWCLNDGKTDIKTQMRELISRVIQTFRTDV